MVKVCSIGHELQHYLFLEEVLLDLLQLLGHLGLQVNPLLRHQFLVGVVPVGVAVAAILKVKLEIKSSLEKENVSEMPSSSTLEADEAAMVLSVMRCSRACSGWLKRKTWFLPRITLEPVRRTTALSTFRPLTKHIAPFCHKEKEQLIIRIDYKIIQFRSSWTLIG